MAADVEISRALNALSTTLNDQRLTRMDLGRLQEIVTLALGGERHLHVTLDAPSRSVAWLRDDGMQRVGRVEHAGDGRWMVERCGGVQTQGYVPTPG